MPSTIVTFGGIRQVRTQQRGIGGVALQALLSQALRSSTIVKKSEFFESIFVFKKTINFETIFEFSINFEGFLSMVDEITICYTLLEKGEGWKVWGQGPKQAKTECVFDAQPFTLT